MSWNDSFVFFPLSPFLPPSFLSSFVAANLVYESSLVFNHVSFGVLKTGLTPYQSSLVFLSNPPHSLIHKQRTVCCSQEFLIFISQLQPLENALISRIVVFRTCIYFECSLNMNLNLLASCILKSAFFVRSASKAAQISPISCLPILESGFLGSCCVLCSV